MMYASLSAYMHDKKNVVTLFSKTGKSPSLDLHAMAGVSKQRPHKMTTKSYSVGFENLEFEAAADQPVDVRDIHAAVLASKTGTNQKPPPKVTVHSLEDEIREMDIKESESGTVTVLSVETGTDSMLVKLLNYLKDHKVGLVKIQKQIFVDSNASSRKSSIGASDDQEKHAEQKESSQEEKSNESSQEKNPDESSKDKKSEEAKNNKPRLKRQSSRYDVFVNLHEDGRKLNELLVQIERQVGGVRHRRGRQKQSTNKMYLAAQDSGDVEISPGFPMRINELDIISKHVLMYGAELDADHPGFKDAEYRKRRMMFGQIALEYQHGQDLPRVEYSDSEKRTWRTVFTELMRLYPEYACNEFLVNMQMLQQENLYSDSDVPQLQDVSRYLKARSGFQLRPVAGYLSPRDFLAGLAFRVFHTTQYIRHPSEPFYSPEPDCCHELLGHVPMLADPEFAQFSQEIGLASLGASEEDIKRLAILYFFTIEFGLCRATPNAFDDSDERPPLRVYGAGLLSCVAELKHVLSDEAIVKKFNPLEATETECMITTFQNTYFYNDSFTEAVEDVRQFADAIRKPFTVRYNPYTESLEIIDNVRRVERLISELRQDATILTAALRRLGYDGKVKHYTVDNYSEDLP